METSRHVLRLNGSFLAGAEQRLIRWLLPQVPKSITSLNLTILGLFGSALAGAALILCNWSVIGLPIVASGVLLNWFGDSLDGSLARYRANERPRFGFLVDHTCDLFSQVIVIVCFGFSPFLSIVSALVVLLCYLLFSAYTYIRSTVQNIHQMAYIGVGATEFRILTIVWSFVGSFIGLRESPINGISRLDITIGILGVLAVIGLAIKAFLDAREIAAEEDVLSMSLHDGAPLNEINTSAEPDRSLG